MNRIRPFVIYLFDFWSRVLANRKASSCIFFASEFRPKPSRDRARKRYLTYISRKGAATTKCGCKYARLTPPFLQQAAQVVTFRCHLTYISFKGTEHLPSHEKNGALLNHDWSDPDDLRPRLH